MRADSIQIIIGCAAARTIRTPDEYAGRQSPLSGAQTAGALLIGLAGEFDYAGIMRLEDCGSALKQALKLTIGNDRSN
jgi:hypothetical protein